MLPVLDSRKDACAWDPTVMAPKSTLVVLRARWGAPTTAEPLSVTVVLPLGVVTTSELVLAPTALGAKLTGTAIEPPPAIVVPGAGRLASKAPLGPVTEDTVVAAESVFTMLTA